jgi:hypothetical protein
MTTRVLPAEIEELERLVERLASRATVRRETEVDPGDGRLLPVYSISFGDGQPVLPAVGFFGGVHGLERIGTEVVLAFVAHLAARLDWDDSLHALLARVQVVAMPLVNPGGLVRGTRANPAGVDLMRNAPVEAPVPVHRLLGGQRISARLPWYRGPAGAPLQPESAALCGVVQRELLNRPFALAIDCHSGFGLADRLWFPFAHTRRPIAQLPDVHALKQLFDASHPQHRYLIEPQSRHYCTHGDLWDHLLLGAGEDAPFVPLTLEMGSWTWVRKNPRQLFTRHGMFNPLIDHRRDRVLRRHMVWFDFVLRAAASHARWRPAGQAREAQRAQALALWYSDAGAGAAGR